MNGEMTEKVKRLRDYIVRKKVDGILLNKVENFTWLTCGGYSHVSTGSEYGVATILVTEEGLQVFLDEIERYRIFDEEISEQDFEGIPCDWYIDKKEKLLQIVGKRNFVGDNPALGVPDITDDLRMIRASLTLWELERVKTGGALCGRILTDVCLQAAPGEKEREIQGRIVQQAIQAGIQAPVVLVASDERIFKYRHPIPTDKRIERYLMVVLGARYQGIYLSLTRLVHFGGLGNELSKKWNACANIDGRMILSTAINRTLGEMFEILTEEYANQGYAGEWRYHHQGGTTGYEGRDILARPEEKTRIVKNQLIAWNPSISGVKSEDTIYVDEEGSHIATRDPRWPVSKFVFDNKKIMRPQILVR